MTSRNILARISSLALMLGPVLAASAASAQPTAEQQAAIRGSCRSDFMSNCSGVTPGGAPALQCLQANAAKLSPKCQAAVKAVPPVAAK